MASTVYEPGPGRNVAQLRKERSITQTKLARDAGISPSLLSKIEIGDRTLTPSVAAVLARAMSVRLADVLGTAKPEISEESNLTALRNAYLRYDIPDTVEPTSEQVSADVSRVVALRNKSRLAELLRELPGMLRRGTTRALRSNAPEDWEQLTYLYSAGYWLAARHRWLGDAQTSVTLEQWAASQQHVPVAEALACRDRAGLHMNSGDYDGGITVVERGLSAVSSSSLSGTERAYANGILALRGMTLAGRVPARVEVSRYANLAAAASEDAREEQIDIGITFGPANAATHFLATAVDLGKPREGLKHSAAVLRNPGPLPVVRIGAVHINTARAKLDLGDREGALESLTKAWEVAPERAKVEAMSQEVLRVLVSLHKRSNPKLVELTRRAAVQM